LPWVSPSAIVDLRRQCRFVSCSEHDRRTLDQSILDSMGTRLCGLRRSGWDQRAHPKSACDSACQAIGARSLREEEEN
jgi:hypothetical protein